MDSSGKPLHNCSQRLALAQCLHCRALRVPDYAQKSKFPKWEGRSITARWKHNMPETSAVWLNHHNQMKGVRRCPRVVELVEIGWGARVYGWAKDNPDKIPSVSDQIWRKELARGFCIDLSQCVGRAPWTSQSTGLLRCCTTSTALYSYFHDRMLAPEEVLVMHAFPLSLQIGGPSQAAVQSAAGDMMAAASVGHVLLAAHIAISD